jgi:hypothetical protein
MSLKEYSCSARRTRGGRYTHNLWGSENVDALIRKEVDDDAEGEPYVCQREPGEDKGENIVLDAAVSLMHAEGERTRRTSACIWKKNMRITP